MQENKREIAEQYFLKGYNCAQSVVFAYKEYSGIDEISLLKTVSALGGGIGRLRETCGAVSGMAVVCGWLRGYAEPSDTQTKKDLYVLVQRLAGEFKAINGALSCRELLGLKANAVVGGEPSARTEEYYKRRPCVKMVGDAAEILQNYLTEEGVLRETK